MNRLTAILSATLLLAPPAFAQASGEIELELWRSAARIDTPAAYEAYLAAYPNGRFATMARAAVAARGEPAAAVPEAAAPSALATYNGGVTSGATDLAVGTRLVGPGVVTIGSVGARRQLVLPAGEWVLLAAEDHRSGGTAQFSLASLAFGQFSGARLRSLLVTSFNRRAVAIQSGNAANLQAMGMLPRWTAAEQCEAAGTADLFREVAGTPALRHCAAVRPADDWRAALAATPLAEPVDATLKALRATTSPFALRSELHFTDQRYGWLAVTRLDTAAAGAVPARIDWLRRYVPLARRGYGRELEVDDLQPGQAVAAKGLELPE